MLQRIPLTACIAEARRISGTFGNAGKRPKSSRMRHITSAIPEIQHVPRVVDAVC